MHASVTDPAEFEDGVFGYSRIKEWAQSDTGGGLPTESAQPFANWLDGAWNQYDDASGTQTNEDILTSARDYWTGKA